MDILIGVNLGILASTGGIWYIVGRLVAEVRGHNRRLDALTEKVDRLLNGGK